MSDIEIIEVEVEAMGAPAEVKPGELEPAAHRGWLRERGLTTVEYAIGVVLVLALVGIFVAGAGEGWWDQAAKGVVNAIFDLIKGKLG